MFQQTQSNINTFFTSYLESRATIKILVVPVGNISNKHFQSYFNRLCQFSCIPLQTVTPPSKVSPADNNNASTFGKLKLKRNSLNENIPVFNISYEYGAIYFQFINGKKILERNELSTLKTTDLNAHDQPLAIFGLCHCPTTDNIAEAFLKFQTKADNLISPNIINSSSSSSAKNYVSPSKKRRKASLLKHCFAFDITDFQLEAQDSFSDIEDLTVFVADRCSSEGGGSILEFQMQVDLGNICNKIIHSLDVIVKNALSGKHMPSLRYGLDPSLAKEDAIMRNKQKKKWDIRYAARLRKWCADYCLVAGSPLDALEHYTMALTLMKQNGKPIDHLWLGSCYEGYASANIMASIQALDIFSDVVAVATGAIDAFNSTRIPFQNDVERNCMLAIKHYKECKLEIERYLGMILKLCRYYARLIYPKPVTVMKLINVEAIVYVDKIRTPSRIRFYVEVCLLCETMGLRRKFGYYCHKIATMYADLMNWNTALCFLQLASEAYGCGKNHQEKRKESIRVITNAYNNVDAKHKATSPWIATDQNPSSIENTDGWPEMKKQYLLELLQLSILTNNHDLGTKYAIETLRELQTENIEIATYNGDESINNGDKIIKTQLEVEDLFGVKQQHDRDKSFNIGNNNNIVSAKHASPNGTRPPIFKEINNTDRNDLIIDESHLSINAPMASSIYTARDDINSNPSMWLLPDGRSQSQLYIMKKLHAITSGLMPKISVDMTNIPEICMIEPCPVSAIRQHKKYIPSANPHRLDDISLGQNSVEDLKGATNMAKHGTKIYYDPFSKEKDEDKNKVIEWVKGENCEVLITLRNNLKVPLYIQDITIVSENNDTDSQTESCDNGKIKNISTPKLQSFGQSLYCPPLTTQKIKLIVKPLVECEQLYINAVAITICNLTWCHLYKPVATSKKYIRGKKHQEKLAPFPYVRVLEPLPLMIIRDVRNNHVPLSTDNNQKSSRLSGTNVTNLALLDGQVHNHGLLVQNVGCVPISYIRIKLVLVKRKMKRLNKTSYHQRRGIANMRPPAESLQRLNPVTIFSTIDNENPSSFYQINDGDNNKKNNRITKFSGVFYFEPDVLLNVKLQLPLASGAKVMLPFTIDAQRDIPAAELIIDYGQGETPAIYRSITMPYKMMTSSSIRIVSIDTASFQNGILEEYGDFGALSNQYNNNESSWNSNSNSNFFLILLVSNPTKRSFEISGYRHLGTRNDVDLQEVDATKEENDNRDATDSIKLEIPNTESAVVAENNAMTPEVYRKNSFITPNLDEDKRHHSFSSASSTSSFLNFQRQKSGPKRTSSSIFGDSDTSSYENIFITPLDAGELQRIVIPIPKYAYPDKIPVCGSKEDQVKGNMDYDLENAMIQNFVKKCVAYVQSKLRLTWKSSNGMVGTLSLHTALSTLTLNACKRMVQIPVKITTFVYHNDEKYCISEGVVKVKDSKMNENKKHEWKGSLSGNNDSCNKYYDGTTDYPSPVKLSNIREHNNIDNGNNFSLRQNEQIMPFNICIGDRLSFSFKFEYLDFQKYFSDQNVTNKLLVANLNVLKVTQNGENIYVLNEDALSGHVHFNGMTKVAMNMMTYDECLLDIQLLFLRKGKYRFLLECDDGVNKWINEISTEIIISS